MKIIDCRRDGSKNELHQLLKEREPDNYGKYEDIVNDIVQNVKKRGNEAVFAYTKEFDHFECTDTTMKVTKEEIQEAYTKADEKLVGVIRKAKQKILEYHNKQVKYSWFDTSENGTILGQKITPINRVGVYVPGGKAVYPSSVLMNVIPARVAGVNEIIMTTPANSNGKVNPLTLITANECGIENIYKIGGAQGIAAMAYGTESIQKVDKIVGPGNIFVALAKKAVYGHVSIDSIAGPSEVLVIADESANPKFVAADLLSQAEHDELASSLLVTTSEEVADKVQAEIRRQVELLSRREIMNASLESYGAIIIVSSIDEGIEISNDIAPEHLEVCTKDPFMILPKIKNAGAIFLGHYSPEPLGDYMAGPNHVLPTNGTAKFFSPLSVDDFIKKSSIIAYNREALEALSDDIVTFANAEQLTAHANSIKVRFDDE